MPETTQEHHNGNVQLSTGNNERDEGIQLVRGSTYREPSMRGSSDEKSSIALPFDLQPDLEEDNTHDRTHISLQNPVAVLTLRSGEGRHTLKRLRKALRPHKRYPVGYEKGRVEQIIRSCMPITRTQSYRKAHR